MRRVTSAKTVSAADLLRAAFDLVGEAAVIEVLTGLAEGRIADGDGRKALTELLGIGTRADSDVRILAALRRCGATGCGIAWAQRFSTAFRGMFGMMPSELLKGLEPAAQ